MGPPAGYGYDGADQSQSAFDRAYMQRPVHAQGNGDPLGGGQVIAVQQYPGGPMVLHVAGPAESDPDAERLGMIFQMGRALRVFTLIDIIFLIFWVLVFWPLIFLAVFPLCGYVGGRDYDYTKTTIYYVFCVLNTIARLVWLVAVVDDSAVRAVLIGIGVAIEAYIAVLVWRFMKLIRGVTQADRDNLERLAALLSHM